MVSDEGDVWAGDEGEGRAGQAGNRVLRAISRLRSKKKMEEKILELEVNKQDKLVFASEDTCESIIDELV